MTITFEQFQTSGKACTDLGAALSDDTLSGAPGRLYCDVLFIEDATDWTEDAPGFGQGRWHTLIGREEYQSDKLEDIERVLHEWADAEGYDAPEQVYYISDGEGNALLDLDKLFANLKDSGVDEATRQAIEDGVAGCGFWAGEISNGIEAYHVAVVAKKSVDALA